MVAVALALAVSLSMPNKYTATCRILVEPPPGSDARGAMAVSPIYLESLKTYEHFASNDSLFVRALDRFHLRQKFPNRPVEALKSGILKVAMVRDTKILEIKVTLSDPNSAQALARYLGEETIKLSQSIDLEGEQDLARAIGKEESDARERLEQSEAAWSHIVEQRPVEGLQQEIQNGTDLKSDLERQMLQAELDASEAQPSDAAAAHARVETLRKQLAQVDREITAKEDLLGRRMAERDRLDAERTASQTAYTTIESRLGQSRGDIGYRGERLKIIDPGIVPERPSSPNVPLNVFAALLLGLAAPIVYLTLELSYQTQRPTPRRSALRVAGTGRDE